MSSKWAHFYFPTLPLAPSNPAGPLGPSSPLLPGNPAGPGSPFSPETDKRIHLQIHFWVNTTNPCTSIALSLLTAVYSGSGTKFLAEYYGGQSCPIREREKKKEKRVKTKLEFHEPLPPVSKPFSIHIRSQLGWFPYYFPLARFRANRSSSVTSSPARML